MVEVFRVVSGIRFGGLRVGFSEFAFQTAWLWIQCSGFWRFSRVQGFNAARGFGSLRKFTEVAGLLWVVLACAVLLPPSPPPADGCTREQELPQNVSRGCVL